MIEHLDAGKLRVAEKINGEWVVHQWLKKAVLLSFRLEDNVAIDGGGTQYFDKVPSKFAHYVARRFRARRIPRRAAGDGAARRLHCARTRC